MAIPATPKIVSPDQYYVEKFNELAGCFDVYVGMAVPHPGEIRQYTGAIAPDGWAICDGAALNQAVYPDLFSVLGARYGVGGAGTFRLPTLAGHRPAGAVVGSIQAGDVFTAHLPGDVAASYAAIAGDGVDQVAAGLCAAIQASAGYSGQAFTATVSANEVTLTAKLPGVGFDIELSTATAPILTAVAANVLAVAQVDLITIGGVIDSGDVFTAHLPGGVDAGYTATAGGNSYGVAISLCAAIVASAGYSGQAFTATVDAGVISLTAKIPGVGFSVSASAVNGGADNTQSCVASTYIANFGGVAQVSAITIDPVKCSSWPAVVFIIKL